MLLEAQYQATTHQTAQCNVFLKDVHHEDAACFGSVGVKEDWLCVQNIEKGMMLYTNMKSVLLDCVLASLEGVLP